MSRSHPKKNQPSPAQIREVLRFLASRGGKAGTGKAKARSSEQARAAVNARWAKARAKKKSPVT